MTTAEAAFDRAMEKLLLQVSSDNVIAVGHAFHKHADDLRGYLLQLDRDAALGPCGGDPVSQDVLRAESFAGKVRTMVDVHWDHCRELEAVAARLEDVAKSYGFTEAEIAAKMRTQ